MVAVFDSINKLRREVETLCKEDVQEILLTGYPPCFKEFCNCKSPCWACKECEENTIYVNEKELKGFGL